MTNAAKYQAEIIWLMYFNDVLFEMGVISEREHGRMRLKIQNRKLPSSGSEQ